MANLIERRYPVYIETTTNAVVFLNTQFVLGDTLNYIEFFFKKGSEDIKPKGKQFMVNIERPTGTTSIFSVESILEDRVIWRLQDTATNVVGKYKASISMVDEVGRYSSFPFNYEVKKDIGGKDIGEEGDITTDDRYQILTNLINRVENIGEIDKEIQDNEAERKKNELDRVSSETIRKDNETKRIALYNDIKNKFETGQLKGDMTTDIYDKNKNGIVDKAEEALSVEWTNVKNVPEMGAVKSVNSKTGDVVLSTSDITTSNDKTLEEYINNINTDIKSNSDKIGDLSIIEKELIDKLTEDKKDINIVNAINYLYKNGSGSIALVTIQNLTATSDIEGTKAILSWKNPIVTEYQKTEIYVSTNDLTSANYDYCVKNTIKIVDNKIESFEHKVNSNGTYYFKAFAIYSIFGVTQNSDGIVTSVKVIDTKPPSIVTNIDAIAGNGEIALTWTNPSDVDFSKVKIVRKKNDKPINISDGVVVYEGGLTSYKDTGLTNNVVYYYRFFTYDKNSNINDTDTQYISTTPLANGYDKPISSFTAKAGNAEVVLNWVNPTDSNFSKVMIRRKVGSYPSGIFDGVLIYEGNLNTCKDTNLTNETEYYYRAFTFSTNNQYCDITTGQQATATPNVYVIYGVKIDTTNSNTVTAVTYTDNAVGFTPASGNNGSFDYGSWQDKFPFNAIKPCLYKNGAVNYYLNPNDYTKKIDGSNADIISGNDGDVMVEFPKIYWKFEKIGNDLYIRYSDIKVDSGYKCLAHMRGITEKDKCYISAYLGHELSSKLRSLSDKTVTTNKTIGNYRILAKANGSNYDLMAYYQLLMLQVLFIVMFKSRDSQIALGRGYVDKNSASITTGGTNQKGMFYGEITGKLQNKFCGIEDFWGNCLYRIDGLYSDSNRNILIANQNFNDTGSGYTNYGQGATTDISGYISDIQGGTETGFLVKATEGSESTFYADYGNLYGGCLPGFGSNWAVGSYTGAFRLYVGYFTSYASSDVAGRSFAL